MKYLGKILLFLITVYDRQVDFGPYIIALYGMLGCMFVLIDTFYEMLDVLIVNLNEMLG